MEAMKKINFSEETILKSVGSLKMYGFIKVVKGHEKRSQLIDMLIDELEYVTPNALKLTPKGDEYLRANFARFNELIKDLKTFN